MKTSSRMIQQTTKRIKDVVAIAQPAEQQQIPDVNHMELGN